MEEQKFVEFDYQRYLDGDEIYYRKGDKFEGEIFLSEININFPLIANNKFSQLNIYKKNGYLRANCNANDLDLVMLPKKKKLWIAVEKIPGKHTNENKVVEYYSVSTAREDINLLKKQYTASDNFHFIQIEIEE